MQTLDRETALTGRMNYVGVQARCSKGLIGALLLVAVAVLGTGCKKDVAVAAIETDANGFVCLKCGAKFYTEHMVSLGTTIT
jgi:hypothetical protein